MKKTAICLVVVVLMIFLVIMIFTSALGDYFGKKAEMAALIAIATALFIMLILNNRDKGN